MAKSVSPGAHEIIVRDGIVDDINSVIDLTNEMYGDFADEYEIDPLWENSAREWLTRKLASNDICIAVAENGDGEIVGSGIGIIYDDIPQFWLPNGKLGYIRWMSTTKHARGRGIGQKILDYLKTWHLDNDVDRIMIHSSHNAYPFYKRNDFRDTLFPNMFWSAPDTPGFDLPE